MDETRDEHDEVREKIQGLMSCLRCTGEDCGTCWVNDPIPCKECKIEALKYLTDPNGDVAKYLYSLGVEVTFEELMDKANYNVKDILKLLRRKK